MARVGASRFLFTGDAEAQEEEWLLRAESGCAAADVLKVAHHGSSPARRRNFSRRCGPAHRARERRRAQHIWSSRDARCCSALRGADAAALRTDRMGTDRAAIPTANGIEVEARGERGSIPKQPDDRRVTPIRWLIGEAFSLPEHSWSDIPSSPRHIGGEVASRCVSAGGVSVARRSPASRSWRTIFLAPGAPLEPELLLHELRHVHQFEADHAFPLRYVWRSVRHGYIAESVRGGCARTMRHAGAHGAHPTV